MLLCIFTKRGGSGSARGVVQRAVTVKSEMAKNCCRIFMTVHVRTRTWDRGHTGLLQGCPPPFSPVSLPSLSFYIPSSSSSSLLSTKRCTLAFCLANSCSWRQRLTLAGVELDTQLPYPHNPIPLDVLLQLTNPGGHEFMFVWAYFTVSHSSGVVTKSNKSQPNGAWPATTLLPSHPQSGYDISK